MCGLRKNGVKKELLLYLCDKKTIMLLRVSKVPPPFHSFRTGKGVLCDGPAFAISKKIQEGSVDERKDAVSSLAVLLQEGKIEAYEAVALFGKALCDDDRNVRNLAFLNLARMGGKGLDGLFCGLSSADETISKMSFDMICSVISNDEGTLRSANFEAEGVRDKVKSLIGLLGNDARKFKATACLRQIAERSPLAALEEVMARKGGLRKDSEEYYRLNLIEAAAVEALKHCTKEAGC